MPINPYDFNTNTTAAMITKSRIFHTNKNKNKKKKKNSSISKKQREVERIRVKSNSPGVPANTCPYIDLAITCINDLATAYERMRTKGEHNPMIDDIQQHAIDTLEFVRRSNETLRDNSAYWYSEYKDKK